MIKSPSNTKKSIIVIEDDEILLDAYRYYIESFDDYILKGTFMNVNDALESYNDMCPDIVLSDISMPGINGIRGAELIKKIDKKVKIIMVTVHDDKDSILNSLKFNADGYLTKPINRESLKNALEQLEKNGAPLSSDIAKKLIKIIQVNKVDQFSDRENEIMDLLSKGYSYGDISEKLFITRSTVNFHIQSIYLKLDVNSKSEAIKKVNQILGKI